jgi:MFS family permease
VSGSRDAARSARWPADLLRLGWISLWVDVASEMSTPLIPLYLGSLALSPALALGWIEGTTRALHSCLSAAAGWHSDRTRRRLPYVRWGYGLAVGSKVALAAACTWPVLLALRLVDRFGKGLRTAPRDALIAELAPGRRGAAFGLHRAMDTAGALVGVLLAAAALAWMPGRYRTVFVLSALPGLMAVALTLRLGEPERAPAAVAPRASPLAALRSLPRPCLRACALQWLLSLATLSESFLILRASELGLGDTPTLLLYALFNVTQAASALPAGRLSDAIGRRSLLAVGAGLHALTLAVALAVEGAGVGWLFALFGLQQGLTQGVGKAWVADRAPVELRATALGALQLGNGLALLVGGVGAGWLWQSRGPDAALAVLAALGALALLTLWLFGAPVPSPHAPGEDDRRDLR